MDKDFCIMLFIKTKLMHIAICRTLYTFLKYSISCCHTVMRDFWDMRTLQQKLQEERIKQKQLEEQRIAQEEEERRRRHHEEEKQRRKEMAEEEQRIRDIQSFHHSHPKTAWGDSPPAYVLLACLHLTNWQRDKGNESKRLKANREMTKWQKDK